MVDIWEFSKKEKKETDLAFADIVFVHMVSLHNMRLDDSIVFPCGHQITLTLLSKEYPDAKPYDLIKRIRFVFENAIKQYCDNVSEEEDK